MDVVEMPPVTVGVTEDPPTVLTGNTALTWLHHILHLVLFLLILVILQADTDQAHGVVVVLVDLVITVYGQLVVLGLAGDLDVIGIHHDDTLVVVITVTHLAAVLLFRL